MESVTGMGVGLGLECTELQVLRQGLREPLGLLLLGQLQLLLLHEHIKLNCCGKRIQASFLSSL